MSAYRNLTLFLIIAGIIGISYKFLPSYSVRRIFYNPTCIKLQEKNEYLCAYCCINSLSNELQTKSLVNKEGFKAIGIKTSQSLTCQQYLQSVDYEKYPMKSNEIQIQKMDIIANIFNQLKAQYIMVNGNNPTDIIIPKNSYKSIVIFQTNKQKKMNTIINQIVQEAIISKIVTILVSICLLLIVYHIGKNFMNNKYLQYSIFIHIIILILTYFISRQKLRPNSDQFQLPAILFFFLCLIKVNTNIYGNILLVISLLIGYQQKITDLVTISYAIATILYIIKTFSQPKHQKIFVFVSVSMITYIFSQRYRISDDLDPNINYYLGKMIQVVILTMVTTLMETNNQTRMQQFSEVKKNIYNQSQSIQQFQELQQNNFQDQGQDLNGMQQ